MHDARRCEVKGGGTTSWHWTRLMAGRLMWNRQAQAMRLAEALARAETLLAGGPPSADQRDRRWPAVVQLAAFIDEDPDAIWAFVARWGADADAQVRAAVATTLLESLLDKHFARCFPLVESAVRGNPQFADTFLLCWPFGEASQEANARRFAALKQEAAAR